MNAVPANALKRHGIRAVEQQTQAALTSTSVLSLTVADWFVLPSTGTCTKEEIDKQLAAERNSWNSP